MAIEKVRNVRKGYSTVKNAVIDNRDLSLQAKGLLLVLLSNDTEKFEINMKEIFTRSKNGRDAHYNAVKELIKHGYFARVQVYEIKNNKRIFSRIDYIFSDDKRDILEALEDYRNLDVKIEYESGEFPLSENPYTESSNTNYSYTQVQNNNNINNNNINLNKHNSNNHLVNKESIQFNLYQKYSLKGMNKELFARVIAEVDNMPFISNYEAYLDAALDATLYKSKLKKGKIEIENEKSPFYNWIVD